MIERSKAVWRAALAGGLALALGGTAAARNLLAEATMGTAPAPVTSSVTANLSAQQQAQALAARAQNQLARNTQAIQAMQNAQAAARALAQSAQTTVPNGLQTGGLDPDSGLAAPGVANPVSWTGADTPTQTRAGGTTTVTIDQTAAQAILSWNSFNVGRDTTVDFNQRGNSNWVALNKITASGVPSQILGSIKADGQVYLINPNGIIFGGASQVNVGALIASTADIDSAQFLSTGIYSTQSKGKDVPSFTDAKAGIIIEPGALITTNTPVSVTNGGGFVLLMGTEVENGGTITTPAGQTELAAGDNFLLQPGYGTDTNPTSTTRGNEVAPVLTTQGSSLDPGGSGLVVNTGMIEADTGDITLAGETVVQNGVLLATTSVATRGTIHLLSSASDPYSSVTLGSNSNVLVEPDLASTDTELDSQRAALIAASASANAERTSLFNKQFDDLSLLPDRQDESRIEIVTGGSVEFQNGSNSSAPGGQIEVSAAVRAQVDSGAVVDVSGTYGVAMAMAANDLAVNIQSYELRDDAQNRLTQVLRNNTVYVDARDLSLVPASDSYATDRYYTSGGVLEVSGYLANVGHTIGEYTAIGGSIELSTGSSGAIVAATGAEFDIAGGSLNYQAGSLPQSYLLGRDGRIYNVNSAPADVTYTGVYNGFEVANARWGVTKTYRNPLVAPAQLYEAGYTVGRAAGRLTLSSPTTLFNATIDAGTVNGVNQTVADPAGVSDPYRLTQNEVAEPGSLIVAVPNPNGVDVNPAATNVSIGTNAAEALSFDTPIAQDVVGNTSFGADALNGFGLGGLQIITNGGIDVSAPLNFAPGARVALYGSRVEIGADITAAGGDVSAGQVVTLGTTQVTLKLANPADGQAMTADTVVEAGVVVSTAGLWTNLLLDPATILYQAFINGGDVSLGSVNNLILGVGSLIDTASGGVIDAMGKTRGGAGGDIILAAATPGPGFLIPTGNLTLFGRLDAIGATQGGTLTLSAPAFLVTDAPAADHPGVVTLNPSFFTQGFSAYNLRSTGDITIDPGTVVDVTEPTYRFTAASDAAPTGVAPAAALSAVLEPLYVPNASYTAITQRAGASFSAISALNPNVTKVTTAPFVELGQGAAINVDPGQSIALESPGQITIDGTLRAPGGSISVVSDFDTLSPLYGGAGLTSIWLGSQAVLDASGEAVSFANGAGAIVSLAPHGGTITLGRNESSTVYDSLASIIIRQGALIEANGSAAVDELSTVGLALSRSGAAPAGTATPVEGNGGSITLASLEGLYNDGTLTAAAGGPDAAGGSLTMILEADQVANDAGAEAPPRLFAISQNDQGAVQPADLQPGVADPALAPGTAAISEAQIATGKFGSVSLFARDAFIFQGDVTLNAAQSISLEQGYLTDNVADGSVTLNAPYVLLSGATPDTNQSQTPLALVSGFSAQTATGDFTVNAALIDIADAVRFGGVLTQGTDATDLAGFATVTLNSAGDLRFLPPSSSAALTDLVTTANLNLTAREIYAMASTGSKVMDASAVVGTKALVVAGYNPTPDGVNGGFNPDGVLTISRTQGTTPTAPDTLGGSLTFEAATVRQGGVVWQPLGQISFGSVNQYIWPGTDITGGGDSNAEIDFLAGSLTSVSAAGLAIPFGGTTDGVSYSVDGLAISAAADASFGLASVNDGAGTGTITIAALTTKVESGATLDLQGGGTLTGAGFISGQGGSTDVLTTPLLQVSASGVVQPSLATHQVYAIVAGVQPTQAVAYTASGAAGSEPALGETITVPAGIPGLPAGEYTLLPAAYALTPGGYRVEFDGAASLAMASVTALANGSYVVAGYTGTANTNVHGTLATQLTISPAAAVRTYAQYDEESYSDFLVADAARFGAVRPVLPADAGTLVLTLPAASLVSVTNEGLALMQPASGGNGGTLQVRGDAFAATPLSLDIYGAAPAADLAAGTVSLSAAQLDNFDPAILELGIAGKGTSSGVEGVSLEDGATLKAARVVISTLEGGITLQGGSEIDTLGQGTLASDSSGFGFYNNGGASVLDVGNGYLSYTSTCGCSDTEYGPITVMDGASIFTEGSIVFSTAAAVNIGIEASYGGKYLDLAVPEINVGDPAAVGASAPDGLLLTPAILRTLTQGNAARGVPATQILVLTASDSLNFYGSAAIDLGGADVELVINTPAIYGYGTADDVASISAGTIYWNGIYTLDTQSSTYVSQAPGGTVANGPGSGSGVLAFNAQTIVLGYSDLDRPLRDVSLDRLAIGFATVDLNAGGEITANNQGRLAVYQSQAMYGHAGTGGALNLNTPLLTADAAAVIAFTSGGALNVGAASGMSVSANAGTTAGGEIDLTAPTIDISGAVVLPSGKLDLQADQNITLAATSSVDLAGQTTRIADASIYGFGGDLIMESAGGNITQEADAVIDVSAAYNNAGSISVTATDTGGGQVSLLGTLNGASSGGYDGGSVDIRAQSLGDFAALNASLDAGGFFQSRRFDIKQGDLVIGDGLVARNVSVSVDGGSLTVTGLIDASGGGGGSIALAVAQNLTLAPTAVLDAHGRVLQTDSYGDVIASENAPGISLTTTSGTLTLASGAVFDLASADYDPGNSGTWRGDLELNVPRLGSATAGDAAIAAAGPVGIIGAGTIAVNAFWTYGGDTVDAIETVHGMTPVITQAYLDQINNDDTTPFMRSAAQNADLAARVAGLSAYGGAYHFRPGVEITNAGDLTVQGDLDLSGYRYGPNVDPNHYGSGEPGVLLIRAGGDLNVYGSITDGFQQPISDTGTEFANGWVVWSGGEPYGQAVTLPVAVEVTAGTVLGAARAVNFDAPITGGTFQASAVAPTLLTLDGDQTVTVAFVATSDILDAQGARLFAKGTTVPAGTVLPDQAELAAGSSLPFAVTVGPVTWPANTPFTVTASRTVSAATVVLAKDTTLRAGALIPADSMLKFASGQPGLGNVDANGNQLYYSNGNAAPETIATRTAVGGKQGELYGLAQLLPEGDMSWSIGLVAGADLAAAAPGTVRAASALAADGTEGDITLADTHYGATVVTTSPRFDPADPKNAKICARSPALCQTTVTSVSAVPAFSVIRTGTGFLSLRAGGSIAENSSYGVYTAGTQNAAILDAAGDNPYDLAQGFAPTDAALAALVANYQANYPTGGGNVLIKAQGDLNGFISTASSPTVAGYQAVSVSDTDAIGTWLWRQGGAGQPTAWWIEYGSLTRATSTANTSRIPQYTGFQGIGTLGGGNLDIDVGGDASTLDLVVASNGRVADDGLHQNGGGSMDVKIGGTLNVQPVTTSGNGYTYDNGGLIADLRGDALLNVGGLGTVAPIYGVRAGADPRTLDPLTSEAANFTNGVDLVPGDGTITIDARGDVVIDGVGDAGSVQNMVNTTPYSTGAFDRTSGGDADFTLWTSVSAVDLLSVGGDVAPEQSVDLALNENTHQDQFYPPNLTVVAQNGDIYFSTNPVELAPSPTGQLQLLAGHSIIGAGTVIAISGADPSLVATPFNSGFKVNGSNVAGLQGSHDAINGEPYLIDFGLDTPSGTLHAGDTQPALVYAGTGDIIDIGFGQSSIAYSSNTLKVLAAKPFEIHAGRDIVDSGTISAPDVFLNLSANDVTSITAGRDIIESSFAIAGPGNLVVQAGRNLYEADHGVIESIGPLFDIDPNDRNSGAGITVLAGVGAAGPDYATFAATYLGADSTLALDGADQIIAGNDATLYAWLQKSFGYAGTLADAYAYFLTLPAASQEVFLRRIYFSELNASGLEFNDPNSVRAKSYLRGRDAIATLFPTTGSDGQTIGYAGDITMFGGSGIRTDFGGDIETLVPGGATIVGVEGATPPASAGFITQGSGNIDIYALDSVLLGASRVFTTFGGDIQIWTAQGDINAGRGAKTTINYAPVQRVYDDYGNVFLSPTVPSSGAGIATLSPIPEIAPGDINLVAPLGTIDAGEAGIRGSGNLNIAALHVLNAANIQVQGASTGVPTASAPNVGGLTSAGNAAGAAAQAAESATATGQQAPPPSIWIVEILGYGGSEPGDSGTDQHKKHGNRS